MLHKNPHTKASIEHMAITKHKHWCLLIQQQAHGAAKSQVSVQGPEQVSSAACLFACSEPRTETHSVSHSSRITVTRTQENNKKIKNKKIKRELYLRARDLSDEIPEISDLLSLIVI